MENYGGLIIVSILAVIFIAELLYIAWDMHKDRV